MKPTLLDIRTSEIYQILAIFDKVVMRSILEPTN